MKTLQQYLSDNSDSNVVSVVLTDANIEIGEDVSDIKNKKLVSIVNCGDNISLGRLKREEIYSRAAKTTLFNIIITFIIPSQELENLDKLFLSLKNLGFCRVLNTKQDNIEILEKLCKRYNVFFNQLGNVE